MKKMQDYETRCTEEQTHRAYKLGAPIKREKHFILDEEEMLVIINDVVFRIPTTQQMIGWLEDVGFVFERIKSGNQIVYRVTHKDYFGVVHFDSCKEEGNSVRTAIDAALDYLEKQIKKEKKLLKNLVISKIFRIFAS